MLLFTSGPHRRTRTRIILGTVWSNTPSNTGENRARKINYSPRLVPLVSAEHRSESASVAHIPLDVLTYPYSQQTVFFLSLSLFLMATKPPWTFTYGVFFSSLNENQHTAEYPFTFQSKPSDLSCLSHKYFHRLSINQSFLPFLSFSSPLDTQQSLI